MQHIDRLLGNIAPHRQAARTAPKPKRVFVFDASSEQGSSVCEVLIKDFRWIVYGLVEGRDDPVAQGKYMHYASLGTDLAQLLKPCRSI